MTPLPSRTWADVALSPNGTHEILTSSTLSSLKPSAEVAGGPLSDTQNEHKEMDIETQQVMSYQTVIQLIAQQETRQLEAVQQSVQAQLDQFVIPKLNQLVAHTEQSIEESHRVTSRQIQDAQLRMLAEAEAMRKSTVKEAHAAAQQAAQAAVAPVAQHINEGMDAIQAMMAQIRVWQLTQGVPSDSTVIPANVGDSSSVGKVKYV